MGVGGLAHGAVHHARHADALCAPRQRLKRRKDSSACECTAAAWRPGAHLTGTENDLRSGHRRWPRISRWAWPREIQTLPAQPVACAGLWWRRRSAAPASRCRRCRTAGRRGVGARRCVGRCCSVVTPSAERGGGLRSGERWHPAFPWPAVSLRAQAGEITWHGSRGRAH